MAHGQALFTHLVPAVVIYLHRRGSRFVAGGNNERGADSRTFCPLYAGDDRGFSVAKRLLQWQRSA